jgi:hypothetical protein
MASGDPYALGDFETHPVGTVAALKRRVEFAEAVAEADNTLHHAIDVAHEQIAALRAEVERLRAVCRMSVGAMQSVIAVLPDGLEGSMYRECRERVEAAIDAARSAGGEG